MKRFAARALLSAAIMPVTNACPAACTLDVQAVLLGHYDTLAAGAVEGTGRIRVQCTPAAGYALSLTAGQGNYSVREMHDGPSVMTYNLYVDPAHVGVWGDGSGGSLTATGNAADAWHTVYGQVHAGQRWLPAGIYSDQVLVTINF